MKAKYIFPFFLALFLLSSFSCYAQQSVKTEATETPTTETAEPNDYINETLNDYINEDETASLAMQDDAQQDPYEKFNRAIFKFNRTLDDAFFKPIAKTYNAITPSPLNTAVHNIFNNLSEMPTIVNDLLQFNFYQATCDSWRFAVNTTVGLGGALDVASKIDLPKHYEDVGLTLSKWGWKNSSYFVIPILGSSTVRDALTMVPYYYLTIYPYIHPWYWRYAILAARFIDIRAQLLRYQRVYDEAAIDPYVFTRSVYLQRRAYLMRENNGNLDDPYTAENTKQAAANDNNETYYLDDV